MWKNGGKKPRSQYRNVAGKVNGKEENRAGNVMAGRKKVLRCGNESEKKTTGYTIARRKEKRVVAKVRAERSRNRDSTRGYVGWMK